VAAGLDYICWAKLMDIPAAGPAKGTKLRKATISFVMIVCQRSVRPSLWNSWALTGWIS
jgi:hypothetical protein